MDPGFDQGSNHRVPEVGRAGATAHGIRDRLVASYRLNRASGHERELEQEANSAPLVQH